jgi:KUP system potassium uptake protein
LSLKDALEEGHKITIRSLVEWQNMSQNDPQLADIPEVVVQQPPPANVTLESPKPENPLIRAFARTSPVLHFMRCIIESMGFAFGPLAISPLFTFNGIMESTPTEAEILGALCLCIYTLIFIATFQYVIIHLSKSNNREGGMFSLASLVLDSEEELLHTSTRKNLKRFCMVLTIAGASFTLGDIAMTPPLAILASLDGLDAYSSNLTAAVVPLACIILLFLFSIQRLGISKVRLVFGSIMLIWSLCILLIGIYNASMNPRCFQAFNPVYLAVFFRSEKGFFMLGSVILVLTGLEAMHKEIGRFGAGPIRVAWLLFVFPSLLFTYLGQGANLLIYPKNYWNPFYLSIPTSIYWPIFVLAVISTMIAAHAVINSAFYLISQAIALDYFPNVSVQPTSRSNKSEIYIPSINGFLLVITVLLAITFRTSFDFSNAYGISICIVLIITTVLFATVVWVSSRRHWALKLLFVVPFLVIFFPISSLFLAANTLKFPHGAWIPLLMGLCCAFVMIVWTWGYEKLLHVNTEDIALSYDDFNTKYAHIPRSKGIGVFIVNNTGGVPQYVKKHAEMLNSLPEMMILMTVKYFKIPYISENKRMTTVFINDNMIRVTARYGFLEKNVVLPQVIDRVIKKYDLEKFVESAQNVEKHEGEGSKWDNWLIDLVDVEEEQTSSSVYYFLPRDYVKVNRENNFLRRWMVAMFMTLRSGAKNETSRLQIPGDKVFEVGNVVWL